MVMMVMMTIKAMPLGLAIPIIKPKSPTNIKYLRNLNLLKETFRGST